MAKPAIKAEDSLYANCTSARRWGAAQRLGIFRYATAKAGIVQRAPRTLLRQSARVLRRNRNKTQ